MPNATCQACLTNFHTRSAVRSHLQYNRPACYHALQQYGPIIGEEQAREFELEENIRTAAQRRKGVGPKVTAASAVVTQGPLLPEAIHLFKNRHTRAKKRRPRKIVGG